jgi:DNA-binding XRE family transcriptional regulator
MVVPADAGEVRARSRARGSKQGGRRTVIETMAPAAGLPGLRAAREAKLLTQQELADTSGVDRSTISQLESGTRSAHLRTIRRLAEVLNVPPQKLLASAKPMRRPRRQRALGPGALASAHEEESTQR